MKTPLLTSIFILAEVLVAVFILSTTGNMPENIASHFNGAGVPNGFMSQEGYTRFLLVFAVCIPALIMYSLSFALHFASGSVNIPNREYWLSNQNKNGTIQFLKGQVAGLGIFIALFVAYVHCLLLKAHKLQPPQLPTMQLFIGMGVFLVGMLLWGLWLFVKFMRLPKA
jgi:uncharacterized membrane protein